MRGKNMKATILGAASLAFLMAGPGFAADIPFKPPIEPVAPPPPLFNVEFGGAIMSDYVFRGTSQSNRGPSGGAYATAVFHDFFYTGIAAWAIDWPSSPDFLLSSPSAEVDYYVGIRPKFGQWSFDLGWIYYQYPKEQFFDSDFWEVYATAEYQFNELVTFGAGIWYSPDYLNYGIDGTTGTLSLQLNAPSSMMPPDVGFYVSGDVGRVWLGAVSSAGFFVPDYTFWSAGFGWTWKAFTLDFRYHDTDLDAVGCQGIWNAIGSTGVNNWCDQRFVAKLSFDTTVNDLN